MPIDLLADDAFTQKKEPVDLLDFYGAIPEENLASRIGKLPIELIKDVQSGAALRNLGEGVLTGLGKGGQLIGQALTGGRAKPIDIDEVFRGVGTHNGGLSESLEKGLGSYLPYDIAAGPSFIGQTLAGAAHGGATAVPGMVKQGSLEGALFNALIHGAGKTLEFLRPSRLFRGELSPEELEKNLEITRGTETPFGEVVQSPTLKRLQENVLPNITFSNSHKIMQRNARDIKKTGEALLDEIGVKVNEESQNKDLQKALRQASEEARKNKNENYENVNKIADESGLKVGRENFSDSAQKALQSIAESPELAREFSPTLLRDLQHYSNNPEGNTLKLSNIFKGKLRDKANEFYKNGQMYEYGLVKDLQSSLDRDINSAIDSSGNDELKKAHSKSQKNYAENFAPFEDPDVVKFTRQGGDPDLLLSHFLRTGKNQRSVILNKLTQKLKGEQELLPLKMYLSRASEGGELDPMKFRTLYNKLGENQKKSLISDKNLRNKLENYTDLVGKNAESFNAMLNPKTGQRTLDTLAQLLQAGGGYQLLGGIPGAVAGLALPGFAARGANKLLTSPKIRESLIREMLENRPKFSNKIQGTQSLLQTLKAALEQGNDQ